MNNINPYKHHLQIDLNCDMGEGTNNEKEIMPFISSANISCGFHAGNEYTIKKTIEIALEHGVAIGAHPGYDDPENFGRLSQPISVLDLAELINEQIYVFEKIALPMGVKIHHVKLHGALYNDCAKDMVLSKIFVQTIQSICPDVYIYGLSESNTIQQAIILGQPYMQEVFADRTYQKDGTLTPRHLQNALINSIEDACTQAIDLVKFHKVSTIQDEVIKLPVDTICIHGDGYHAIEMAKAIYNSLKEHQIEINYPK